MLDLRDDRNRAKGGFDELAVFLGAPPVPGESAPSEMLFRNSDPIGHWEGEQ